MKINRKNYEVWMIDYFDGKLNADEINKLMVFIDANEDIREEFELFSNNELIKEDIGFSNKEELKKAPVLAVEEINESNYETFFIAAYENDLNKKQISLLSEFLIVNPGLKGEYKIHAQLQLSPDSNIVFEQKETLRKKTAVRPLVYWFTGAAAAAILLFFTTFNLFIDGSGVKVSSMENVTITYLSSASPQFILSPNNNYQLSQKAFDKKTLSYQVEETVLKTTVSPSATTSASAVHVREDIAILHPRVINLNNDFESDFDLISIPAEFDIADAYADATLSVEPEKKKGILGRIIKNVAGRVNKKPAASQDEDIARKDPAFLRVLDQSISVFNTITGSDNELVKTYDEDGSLSNYRFEGQTLGWSRDLTPNSD